ncbi:MAG: Na(+)/H(+) antiporter subunit B [Proteobacteria bacterium]|nr:Na(+)/H(+) antiporter subunit B [Pseudomonadota bacterium]
MLKEFSVIRCILSFIIPFIVVYSIFIQLNGEISPGGGFQAGVIFASSLIGYELISGTNKFLYHFKIDSLKITMIFGVLIYASTGLVSLLFDHNFLDYDALNNSLIFGQKLGIFIIEIGVGITVSATMCLIYILLKED